MANFAYLIKDPKGARKEGIIKANSMDEAIEKLTKEGAMIISVKNAAEGRFSGQLTLFDKLMLTFYKLRNSISLSALVFFTRQLSTMFSAGLTIEKSITDLAREEKNKKFQKVLRKISDDIKKGFSLSEAMEQHPGIFSALYVSLVKAGEVSGTLHTVLMDLSDYLEKVEDTRRKVNSAMAYPVFIIVFLIAVVILMFYWLVPKFAGVYARFDADLPGPTLVAIAISEFITNNVLLTVLMALGALVALFLIYLTERGRFIFDTILLKLPVIGKLTQDSIMSKFARTFSILTGAGIPIMDTLGLLGHVVQNAVIEEAVKNSSAMVKEGYSIAGAFRKTGAFSPTLLQLTATGEETGDLDTLMAKAADFYEKLVDAVIERLTSLIEPLLIIIIATVIGGVIVVVYLPVFNLGLAISGGMK